MRRTEGREKQCRSVARQDRIETNEVAYIFGDGLSIVAASSTLPITVHQSSCPHQLGIL